MPNLFVVEADPVIALDIAETLRDCVPLAQVHVFASLPEADLALNKLTRPLLSVVSLSKSSSVVAPNTELLRRLSDRIVLIGEKIDIPLDESWRFVRRPFSTETLARAVTRFGVAFRPEDPS